jgi:hypothetical protein
LERLQKVEVKDANGKVTETYMQSQNDQRETWVMNDYNSCNSNHVTFGIFGTMATTANSGDVPYAVMQICPW